MDGCCTKWRFVAVVGSGGGLGGVAEGVAEEVDGVALETESDVLKCDYCGQDVTRRPSTSGVPGRPDDAQIDHVEPRASGGHGGEHNGAGACRRCNRDKSTKPLEDWGDELREFLEP